MNRNLPRVLLTGYGLGAIGALLAALTGVGATVSVLVFWLGGALAVLAVAVLFGAFASRERCDEDTEAFAEAAARWESDRLSDARDAGSAAGTLRQAASDR